MKESRYNIWIEGEDAFYVFNGVSGAVLRVPKSDYRAFQQMLAGEDPAGSRELLSRLSRGNMVIPDQLDELAVLAGRYRANQQDTSRFALTIVTSLGCNFDCPYCFEAKHPSLLDDEVGEAVLQVLDDKLPEIDHFAVTWFGGEPLVGKRSLLALSDAFIERCDRNGVAYEADIITNGYLLDVQTCAQLQERRVRHAQITLDGPPEVHDLRRPLASGKGSFWTIVRNLHHAVEYFDVRIRVNIDKQNSDHTERLLQILVDQGFVGKVTIHPGLVIKTDDGNAPPSSTYTSCCFTNQEFAELELQFSELTCRYGFGTPSLPLPIGAPCTAVRVNELVVGSKGELYKCWDSVGNRLEVVGDIRDYKNPNGRLQKWLKYDPFSDPECRGCVALPVCMGGCSHHAMSISQRENRCSTFRFNHSEQVLAFIREAEQVDAVRLRSIQPPVPV